MIKVKFHCYLICVNNDVKKIEKNEGFWQVGNMTIQHNSNYI